MGADLALAAAIRDRLAAAADPARADSMRAYMKSLMPYRGVPAPAQRAIYNEVCRSHPLEHFEDWRDTVLELWRNAEYREERYAAIDLAGRRENARHRRLEALPLYEDMIVTGAWWDLVDGVAIRLVGGLLHSHPEEMRPVLLAWAGDPDLWKRRSAIIAQVGRRRSVDVGLLRACIEPNLADKDFFIRKAIGWALRDYAWSEPEVVAGLVAELGTRLSPLSRREALKNIAPRAAGSAAP